MMKRAAKFFTALAGAAAQIVTLGVVSGDAQHWLTVAVSALTAIAVFMVPNTP